MVHNGIEYADMQLIAEAYLLLKYVGGYDNAAIPDLPRMEPRGTQELPHRHRRRHLLDDEDGGQVLDKIVDAAGKGPVAGPASNR